MKGIINALRIAMSPFICGYITVRILISLNRFHYFYAVCLYTVLQTTGISVRMSANFSVHCYFYPILETEVTKRCHVKSLLHVVFAPSISNSFILVFFFFLDYLFIWYKRSNIVLDYERLNVVSTVFVCLYVCLLIVFMYLCGNYLFLCIDVM